jgi:hypothetical protein
MKKIEFVIWISKNQSKLKRTKLDQIRLFDYWIIEFLPNR